MVKGNPKSSASSATRKKHAKKQFTPADEPVPIANTKKPKLKSEKGGKKTKDPRIKMFIPPVKPMPVQPDPLETTGLAHSLPADLLVVLRTISKKAQVTKIRALEELQAGWVDKCLKEGEESGLMYTLVEMLPVWLHHVSALFVNPSRRVRLIAASLHSSLLQIPVVHDQIIYFLRETASASQAESILGTWCLAAHDVDRSVATLASKTWRETILTTTAEGSSSAKHLLLDENLRLSLNSFVQRTILDPNGVYLYLNPVPPLVPQSANPAKRTGGKGTAVSTPRWEDGGDQTPRSKIDEQEESDQDRRARLRIGGIGAARWILGLAPPLSEDLQTFYSNPALWTSLQSAESCPWLDVESFGFAQPNVRKAAWALVQSLVTNHKDALRPLLPTLSTAVLRSAWVELDPMVQAVMWQPLLMFLKQFPQSWTLDENRKDSEGDDVSGSEADSDGDGPHPKGGPASASPRGSSKAYQEFRQFLELGCSGSPLQGYPTVMIILSTIPSSILIVSSGEPSPPPLDQFFTSFWAAVDGRALSSLRRVATSAAFLSSLLECMVFLIKRMRKDGARAESEPPTSDGSETPSSNNVAELLVKGQFSRLWEEITSRKLKVEERAASRLLGQTLESLSVVDPDLVDAAWDALAKAVKESSRKDADTLLVSAALKVLFDRFKDGSLLKRKVEGLLKEVLTSDIGRCEGVIEQQVADHDTPKASFMLLVNMLEQFREGLFFDEVFSTKLDNLLSQNAFRFLSLSPPLLLSYLLHRKNEPMCLAVWHNLLSSIASGSNHTPDSTALASLLDAAQKGHLPKYLKPQDGELDALIGESLESALAGPMNSNETLLLRQIIVKPDYFISASGYNTFLQTIISTFTSNVESLIKGKVVQLSVFDVTTYLIEGVFTSILNENGLTRSLVPAIFLFAYLIPLSAATEGVEVENTPSQVAAKGLWEGWLKVASEEQKVELAKEVKSRLKSLMADTAVHPVPRDVLQIISQKPPGLQVDILTDIFPTPTQLDVMLDTLSPDSIDASSAVLDDLLPITSSKNKVHSTTTADRRGFTPYARIINGLLQAFVEDRQLAKKNLWALRHFLALSIYAQDLQNIPSALAHSPAFDGKITRAALSDIIAKAKQISVYLFNSLAGTKEEDDTWRRIVVERLLNETSGQDGRTGLTPQQAFLFDVIGHARKQDGVRDARVLKMVLEPLLADGVDVSEADLWIQLARKMERTAPQTAMSIISAITSTGAEPPKLDRYRNELAASLLGIKPQKVNTEGLLTLRKLVACAPDPEGDVAFLPTTRAVNVAKACQAWALAEPEGDDDEEDDGAEMDEEVESTMLPIFMHLAPILQNIPGAHWAFVFDLVEAVLARAKGGDDENSSEEGQDKEDGAMLVALARALRLVIVIEELATRNKSLMAEWKERRMGVLVVIRDLDVLGLDSEDGPSVPQSACRELVLSIVQHLPSSLIDQDTLPKMVHLIEDPIPKVQKMAYQLLKAAAKKRTEYLVIEAGVDTEDKFQATLPTELLDILHRDMHFGLGGDEAEGEEESQNVFGYLLGWMLLFDLFQDSSFKVRSGYIEQLRNSNVVVDQLIPCFLDLLRLNQGGLLKAFKLDHWGVDVFYISLYEPGSPHTIPVLTAHVYYRALLTIPSLIYAWVLDCKDRQLTTAVTTYTSTHFSPVLIRSELEHVRSHAVSDGLADESFTIKVAGAVNEVVAAYSVDDHQLEIKVKIPGDWPLHRAEVKDMKRVGVDENRWRAWVLGVQQTIWANNGRIVDGLGLFKKNVTLHFEGQVECAICYSIISVMDGSLPKKPCKTCKNRFHAGCLYKWFNTSHSSSCPLCRSDII